MVEEKENCHVPRVQPAKEVTGDSKLKVQMKMLNDLLHKLAASKASGSAFGSSSLQQMAKNQFLLKTKSFISPKKGKVTLLGKRSSFNQQKENMGSVQQIYQPIPKRTKLDSPSLQAAQSEHSERSSGNCKNE